MSKQLISIRLSDEVLSLIDNIIRGTSMTRSSFIQKLLEAYLK